MTSRKDTSAIRDNVRGYFMLSSGYGCVCGIFLLLPYENNEVSVENLISALQTLKRWQRLNISTDTYEISI